MLLSSHGEAILFISVIRMFEELERELLEKARKDIESEDKAFSILSDAEKERINKVRENRALAIHEALEASDQLE